MMLWVVGLPFLAALLAPWMCRLLRDRWHGGLVGALAATPAACTAMIVWMLSDGRSRAVSLEWVPALDVRLALLFDGLSATVALLVAGIGTLIVIYSGGYMKGKPRAGAFYAWLLMFMGSMLGLVLADDMISLFVFWELTSISSFGLIGFNHSERQSRDAALKALLVTSGGGLALLAGLLLVGFIGVDSGLAWSEAMRMSTLTAVDIREHPLYPAALLLVLGGAFTKSAQWPLHFWLPAAMVAPTPVSAYLHSATMVKAGVYLLARLNPTLGGTNLWSTLLIIVGAITMLHAAITAVGQTDLKSILAYTTISTLGTLVLLIGIGDEAAIEAAVVLFVAHALYKAALFMVAGNLDHESGTRDATQLGGLRRLMPYSAAAGLLAMLSMAGAPPLLGFMSKELMYEAQLGVANLGPVLIVLALVTNAMMVLAGIVAGVRPFWGRMCHPGRAPHEAPITMLIGPLSLAALGLVVALYPEPFARLLASAMASSVLGEPIVMKLALWHGLSAAALTILGLSTLTLVLGVSLVIAWRRLRGIIEAAERRLEILGPERLYDRSLAGLNRVASLHRALVQHGYLRLYMMTVMLVFIAAGMVPAIEAVGRATVTLDEVTAPEVVAVLLIVAATGVAAQSTSWLRGIVSLGGVGVGVTLLFVLFGAPDLAMTQILIETLTVILFVLVFYHLPPAERRKDRVGRVADLLIAISSGAAMAMLVIAAPTVNLPADLSQTYGAISLPEAHGRNVVNVILVDFRALDTFGEITVVAIAAIGVHALLRLRPSPRADGGAP